MNLIQQSILSLVVLGMAACTHDAVKTEETIVPAAQAVPADAKAEGTDAKAAGEVAKGEAKGPEAAAPAATEKKTKTMYVTASLLNVRDGASMSAKVVRTMPLQTAVEVLEVKLGWAKIGENEYVGAKHVSDITPTMKKEEAPAANSATAAAPVTTPAPSQKEAAATQK